MKFKRMHHSNSLYYINPIITTLYIYFFLHYFNKLNKMNCEIMFTYDTSTYMFNVYKNQLSQQTGSSNLTGQKTFPTIWGTYMKLVTNYQISAINSCWEKCDEKYLRMDRGKTVYPPPVERGYNYQCPRGCNGHDRMGVEFSTTCAISAYHH
jgi:hypothetical protein